VAAFEITAHCGAVTGQRRHHHRRTVLGEHFIERSGSASPASFALPARRRAIPPGYNARMIPILGSMVSPPCSATSISACIAARHANVSCSRFGKPAMKSPASRKVRRSPPSGQGDGIVEAAVPTAQW